MLAISIKTPHIHRIIDGRKTIEVRSWRTSHRGDILLVCSRRPNHPDGGKALAIASLDSIRPMHEEDETDAMTPYEVGLYSWRLSNVRRVDPFDVTGRLGLYEVRLE